jgi:hypothetical protein
MMAWTVIKLSRIVSSGGMEFEVDGSREFTDELNRYKLLKEAIHRGIRFSSVLSISARLPLGFTSESQLPFIRFDFICTDSTPAWCLHFDWKSTRR